MERVIEAGKARREFEEILHEVETRRERFVVERDGEPVAAVIPMELYRQWKQARTEFFERLEEMAQRANVPEDEAASLAAEAVRAARGQD